MFGLKGLLKQIGDAFRVRPEPPSPVVAKPPPAVTPGRAGDAAGLLAATNEARADFGKPPLVWNDRLAAAAWKIAADNATRDQLSHFGSDGSDPWERITAAGYPMVRASENGFTCDPWPGGPATWGDAEHAVEGWLDSKVGHRENLLGDWTHCGGARAVAADGSIYWFCAYATPRG